MKKALFLFAVLTATSSLLAQQDSKISFGIKGGLNAANQLQPDGGGFTDFKRGIGFYVGATGYIGITDRIGIAGEIVVSKLNSTLELDTSTFDLTDFDPVISSVTQESDFTQTVLQLPIMFQFNIIDRVNVQAGPQLSYILDSDLSDINTIDLQTLSDDERLGVDFALGWNIGISKSFYLNGRYYFGLTERDTLKPSVFQLGLTYKL